jgi:hypothetical protein
MEYQIDLKPGFQDFSEEQADECHGTDREVCIQMNPV